MTVYTGIDYHKRTSTICYMTSDGKSVTKTVLSENLVNELVNKLDLHIAIEASCGVNHVADLLKNNNLKVTIINPNKFRGIGIGGKKTDKKDAEALANCLRTGYIPEVYHKSIESRRIKSLLRVREQYVSSRVTAVNHIRGILREYGININVGMESFWEDGMLALEKLDFPVLQEQLKDLFYETKRLKKKELVIEEQLNLLLNEDIRFKNLLSVPGVGLMTAAALIAIGDDFSRFENAKSFASYLGLIPSESSSGDKIRRGAITKAGQEMARRYLIHGARATLIYTNENSKEPIKKWAFKVKERRGMNKATVALAHRIARICFNVISENRIYYAVKKAA